MTPHLAPSLSDYRDWLSAAALPLSCLAAFLIFAATKDAPARFCRFVLALTHIVMGGRP